MPRGPLLLLLALLLPALALLPAPAGAQDETFPHLSGRVVDEAEILSGAAEAQLVDLLAGHEQATTNQVVVVTLSSLRGFDISDYGVRLGRAWGIGQEGKDNGVILIVAPNERAVRIEVGYGLEGQLTDATARIIIEREILPAFKAGDLQGGVLKGANAILAALGGGYVPPPDTEGQQAEQDALAEVVVGLMALLFFGSTIWGLVAGRRGGGGGSASGSGGARRASASGWSSSGGFSGGGGSFGGGGASGRW